MTDRSGSCPFMYLPIELRNRIYTYLLSTEYTRQDTIKKTQISRGENTGDHYKPAHTYHFQPAILTCNRQINEEATAIFRNSNLFVSISHNHGKGSAFCESNDFLANFCKERGLPVLAQRRQARAFRGYAMELYLGRIRTHEPLGTWWNSTKPRHWEARRKFMIAADDLLQFCKLFLWWSRMQVNSTFGYDTVTHLDRSMLLVDVLHPMDQYDSTEEYPRPVVRRLLEPLRYLHHIMLTIIECPAPKSYIEAVKQDIERKAPSAAALNVSLTSMADAGDRALNMAWFELANIIYEDTMDNFRAGSQDYERNERMTEGKWTGNYVLKVKEIVKQRLELGLAIANFHLQRYEMAYHWTYAVILGIKSPKRVVSLMWYYRALSSKGLGEIERANAEMDKALQLMPNDAAFQAEKAAFTASIPFFDRTVSRGRYCLNPSAPSSLQDGVPFSRQIPLEIRYDIYSYLLSTKFTKRPVRDDEKPLRVRRCLESENLYDFQPAILRTNKKIHNEARRFLYDDNFFVKVTYSGGVRMYECMQTEVLSKVAAEKNEVLRLPSTLRISMHVDLDLQDDQDSHVESKFVIAARDLRLFSRLLQWLGNEEPSFLSNINIALVIFPSYQLEIDAPVMPGLHKLVIWNPRPIPQQRILLQPFGTLYGLKTLTIVDMEGKTEHIDARLMKDVRRRVCRLPKSMEEVLLTANKIKDRGNEAFRAGDFRRARSLYRSALGNLNAGARYLKQASETGEPTRYQCDHYQLELRLQSNWVATLLRLQQWMDAHEIATGLIEEIAITKDIATTLYRPNELAKLCFRRALASEGIGKMAQAVEEIHEALSYEPANREMNAKPREWKSEAQSAKQVQATLKALTT